MLKRKITVRYQLFVILLKLNIFFIGVVAALYTVSVYFISKTQAGVGVISAMSTSTWAGVIIVAVLLGYFFLGYWGAKKTNKILMGFFAAVMFLNAGAMVFVIYNGFLPTFYFTRFWIVGFCKSQ